MKDLYRCLEDQIPELLQAIAEAWRLPFADVEPRLQARHLGEAMLAPGALETLLSTLSDDARSLLDDLVRAGGVVPAQRLAPAYGTIRRDGPARLAREQPWRSPANPLEELYFAGLVDRANAAIGDYTGPVVLVPTQFVALLTPNLGAPAPLELQSVDAPATQCDEGNALAEDLFALLVTVRHNQVPAPARDPDQPGLRPWPQVELEPRLQGEPRAARLALIAQLANKLGLLREVDGWLRPGPRAREWLRISDARRARSLFLGWRDDRRWSELGQLLSLRFGEQIDVVSARRALIEVLAECPADRWLSTESFLQAVKRRRPDLLRADADYSTWRVTDVSTGEALTGPSSWDRVEGALVRHLLFTSLRWLGVVAVDGSAEQGDAIRITAQGAQLLAGGSGERVPEPPPGDPLAHIADDLRIEIGLRNSLYERWQLERFAQWERQDTQAHYRVSADSLWRGYNAGVEVTQVVRFLKRVSGDQLPDAALRELLSWGGRFGRVSLREMLLLQTDDERTMKQITSRAELRALLGNALSPTTCLVERSKATRLLQELQALNIWPKLLG